MNVKLGKMVVGGIYVQYHSHACIDLQKFCQIKTLHQSMCTSTVLILMELMIQFNIRNQLFMGSHNVFFKIQVCFFILLDKVPYVQFNHAHIWNL